MIGTSPVGMCIPVALKSCPSPDTHTWEDDYDLGSICRCSTWQVIEIIDLDTIRAIDCAGNTQIFDRDSKA